MEGAGTCVGRTLEELGLKGRDGEVTGMWRGRGHV